MRIFYVTALFCLMGFAVPAQSVETRDPLLRHSKDDRVYTVVEKQPEFTGGYKALQAYLKKNLQYPAQARKAGIKGRVFLSFVVHKDGQITDVSVLKGLGSGCDEEAVRVINAMPRWIPGSQDGRPLNVKYNWPISFGIPYPTVENSSETLQPAPKLEHLFAGRVEAEPQFPGGVKALMQYISSNARYPEAAKQAGITGRVFVSFVIDTKGRVSQPQILRGLGYGCDAEAVRLVQQMPHWKPGTISGKTVSVKYNLPINFPPK